MIAVKALTKKYGDLTAVDGLTLSIGKGEIFGLLGPNGAGKSTTILMLLGLTEIDSGSAKVCGIDPMRNPIEVKKRVGYLPEDVGFYNDLTGLQNLLFTAKLNNIPKDQAKQEALRILDEVGLLAEKDKMVGKYSKGMRQRLGLADVLVKKPEVVIMDEPTQGLDPVGMKKFLQLIVRLSRTDGITVLFSSHHLHQVQQVCDRVGIFVKGKLLAEGNISSLAEQLFSKNTFTTEVGIVPPKKKRPQKPVSTATLKLKMEEVLGVARTVFKDCDIKVESSRDVAPELSSLVVNSGYGLSYLHKKKYGLDDIYDQYFQDEINTK
ncbi:ABC transporter ATP-binding protein [Flavobacteriaceae bacterium F89]|uniref:ABC transporter ATP-binding protein n=1 Tax=Cerina litoralis TaxID=2874477 RepID=A0AAE3ES83_9FLAO|nr:ABC transporter ATP-binding protein [Cerina litoralis]MCG2459415.1 ABC transporter ATP-binding protein [Cerina litoralis]